MTILGSLAVMAAYLSPTARRWRASQTVAESRIERQECAIKDKLRELDAAVNDMKRGRVRLDLIIRAGRKLRPTDTVAASFGETLAHMGHRITGHD